MRKKVTISFYLDDLTSDNEKLHNWLTSVLPDALDLKKEESETFDIGIIDVE